MKLGKSVLNYPVVKFAFTDEEIARMANEADYLEKENKRNLDEMYTADKPDALKLRDHLLAASGTTWKLIRKQTLDICWRKENFIPKPT